MKAIKPKLLKIVLKYCSQRDICRDIENQCKPKICKYFKHIVLKTWLKDIQGKHKRHWWECKEYKEYEAIVDFVY